MLANELGVDPSPELRRVHEQVLRQDAARHLYASVPSLPPRAGDVATAVDEVIERAIANTVHDQYSDAPALAAALREAFAATSTTTTVPASPPQNPYKGLRAFREADADDYFGRDELAGRLLARLAGTGPQHD